jgi:hypothetical protein
LSEVKKHRKLSNKASSDKTFSYITRKTRRTGYLRISAHSAQQDLSGDDHFSMYVMTDQIGPCFVHVNQGPGSGSANSDVSRRGHRVISCAGPRKC